MKGLFFHETHILDTNVQCSSLSQKQNECNTRTLTANSSLSSLPLHFAHSHSPAHPYMQARTHPRKRACPPNCLPAPGPRARPTRALLTSAGTHAPHTHTPTPPTPPHPHTPTPPHPHTPTPPHPHPRARTRTRMHTHTRITNTETHKPTSTQTHQRRNCASISFHSMSDFRTSLWVFVRKTAGGNVQSWNA